MNLKWLARLVGAMALWGLVVTAVRAQVGPATSPASTAQVTGGVASSQPATTPATTPATAPATAPATKVRIGAVTFGTEAAVRNRWMPTVRYLNRKLPAYAFDLVPLKIDAIAAAVDRGEIDFVITNSANYVELEFSHGASRLATLKTAWNGTITSTFGAVIFVRADRTDLNSLSDLAGKSFMAVDATSFAGWWMAWREFKSRAMEPPTCFSSLTFAGNDAEKVVYAVRDRKADAGTVRTDLLEKMEQDGKINLADFRVLNERGDEENFPYLLSTRLYPEWPIATLRGTSESLAGKVAIALLQMPETGAPARAAGSAGWTIPMDYSAVHELLRDLRKPPYENYGKVTFRDVTTQHRGFTFGAIAFVVGTAATLIYVLRLHLNQKRLSRRLEHQLSEQKSTETQLAESEAFYHSLVEHLPQLIIRKDVDGRFMFGNPKFCAEIKKSLPEIRGKTDADLFPKDLADKYRNDDLRVMETGELFETVEEHVTGEGKKLFVHVIKTPVRDAARKVMGTQGIFWDVTQQKLAEIARHEAEQRLQEQNGRLEESVRSEYEARVALMKAQGTLVQTEKLAALGQMVAGVAHEINNPLSFVSNNVAVMQRDVNAMRELLTAYEKAGPVLAERAPELAAVIGEIAERFDAHYTLPNLEDLMIRSREGLKRIQQIVKDLRDFARLDTSDLHEVNLNEGVESTVNIIRGRAKRKQINLETRLGTLPLVACYPAKINQVLMNLIANAIDACGDNGTVTISTQTHDSVVEIAVKDTGTGIDPAVREKIFDPFFTTKPLGEGTGLGLSISYGIIQDHGGTILVESEVGRGSTFTVQLPRDGQKVS